MTNPYHAELLVLPRIDPTLPPLSAAAPRQRCSTTPSSRMLRPGPVGQATAPMACATRTHYDPGCLPFSPLSTRLPPVPYPNIPLLSTHNPRLPHARYVPAATAKHLAVESVSGLTANASSSPPEGRASGRGDASRSADRPAGPTARRPTAATSSQLRPTARQPSGRPHCDGRLLRSPQAPDGALVAGVPPPAARPVSRETPGKRRPRGPFRLRGPSTLRHLGDVQSSLAGPPAGPPTPCLQDASSEASCSDDSDCPGSFPPHRHPGAHRADHIPSPPTTASRPSACQPQRSRRLPPRQESFTQAYPHAVGD